MQVCLVEDCVCVLRVKEDGVKIMVSMLSTTINA